MTQSARVRGTRLLALALALVGVGQPALIALAFGRVIDPGWPAFGAISTLVGIGMALFCGSVAATHRSRHQATFDAISLASVVASLVAAGAWLSLFGGTFFTNDVPRLTCLVVADLAFAVWMIVAAFDLHHPRMPAWGAVASFLAIRAVLEVPIWTSLVWPTPYVGGGGGGSSGIWGVYLAGLIVSGYILYALWEIRLAMWLARRVG